MSGIFRSEYLKAYGTVLPGWIVGTAGAIRIPLPPGADKATEAKTKVYGYLLATVHNDGVIDFKFHEINRDDIPKAVEQRYTSAYTDFCFNENTDFRTRSAAASKEPAKSESEKK